MFFDQNFPNNFFRTEFLQALKDVSTNSNHLQKNFILKSQFQSMNKIIVQDNVPWIASFFISVAPVWHEALKMYLKLLEHKLKEERKEYETSAES